MHSLPVALGLQVLRGAATLVVDVLAITALQRSVSSEVIGRVLGIFFTLIIAAIALGTLVAPALTSTAGLNAALWTVAVAPSLLGLLAYPALARLDREAQTRVAALESAIAALDSLDLFADADRPLLERLATASSEIDVGPGEVVIRKGEPADALYVILDGRVRRAPTASPCGRSGAAATSARSACSSASPGPPP